MTKAQKNEREKIINEFITEHESAVLPLSEDTKKALREQAPEAVRVYKRMYRAGYSAEAIKAEIQTLNWSIGGWLVTIACRIADVEL
jgi:hypothetical protein